jgi:hypothetical protein
MDARSAALTSLRPRPLTEPLAHLIAVLTSTLSGMLLVLAAVLFIRRVAGAFQQPLESAPLIAIGATIAAVAALVRMTALRPARRGAASWPDRLRFAGPSIAVMLLGYTLSLPGSTAWSVAIFWTVLLAEEAGCWFTILRRHPLRLPQFRWPLRPVPPILTRSASEAIAEFPVDSPADQLPPDVLQQITRARASDGAEVITGHLRCDFAPGERSQTLHVAFCPPLDATPTLTLHQLSGPSATIRPTQVHPYGARLDLRLSTTPRDAATLTLQFTAQLHAETQQASHVP